MADSSKRGLRVGLEGWGLVVYGRGLKVGLEGRGLVCVPVYGHGLKVGLEGRGLVCVPVYGHGQKVVWRAGVLSVFLSMDMG